MSRLVTMTGFGLLISMLCGCSTIESSRPLDAGIRHYCQKQDCAPVDNVILRHFAKQNRACIIYSLPYHGNLPSTLVPYIEKRRIQIYAYKQYDKLAISRLAKQYRYANSNIQPRALIAAEAQAMIAPYQGICPADAIYEMRDAGLRIGSSRVQQRLPIDRQEEYAMQTLIAVIE